MNTDWEDTLKSIIASYDDKEIRKLQNRELSEVINDRMNTTNADEEIIDTLFKTLENAGMKYVSVSIGKIVIPESIIESNQAKVKAERDAEADDFTNREFTKRSNSIYLDLLLAEIIPPISSKKILDEAKGNLGYGDKEEIDHEKEFYIIDEAVSIAKAKTRLSRKVLKTMKAEAEQTLNIREGRTKDYKGLGNTLTNINP